MTFDAVVGNPPYKGGMHLDFLKIAYNISKRWIVWIGPSGWLIDEKGIDKKGKFLRNLVGKNTKTIDLFNANKLFNVGLFLPFAITFIDKIEGKEKIKVYNKIFNNTEIYNSLDDINKWNDQKIYPIIKNKIMNLSKKDNLLNHKNEISGKYFLNFPIIRGHIVRNKETSEMVQDDFYSFFPKDIKIEKESKRRKWGKSRDFYFSFKTEKEAENFLNFLKTRWAMFALSIYKINSNLNRGELASVPWLDWSHSWAEKDFEALIDATPEEIEFVQKNIPDYYNK